MLKSAKYIWHSIQTNKYKLTNTVINLFILNYLIFQQLI